MQLRDIQQQFINASYDANVPAEPFITPSDKLTADERLSIYRGSVRGGLLNALGDIYPVLKKLLGEHAFEGISRHYIDTFPSVSANIADYGSHLGDFIQDFKPLAAYPYLADTAQLEWSWHQVFNETDSLLLDFASLGEMTPEQQMMLRFKRPHASRLLRSTYPIHHIWESNQDDNQNDDAIELVESDYPILVWRQQYQMQVDCLTASQWDFLYQLEHATHFEEAIAQFLSIHPDENISDIFSSAVSLGWIAGFE